MGHAPSRPLRADRLGRDARAARSALFDELDVRLDVGAPVRGLSMADQQLIEIAKALSLEARVLILDEPTASLSAHEVERLFTIVRRLRDRGVAILFVSHRLDEVFELCDRATIFRDGRHVITAPTSELTTADLIRHMVGRAVSLFPKAETPLGDVLLEVEGLTRVGASTMSRSRSARARSSGSPASSAPAGRRSPGSCSGSTARDAAEIRLAGQAGRLRQPVGGDGRGHRLRARGPPPGRPGPRLLDRPERHAADPAAGSSRGSWSARATERAGRARRTPTQLQVRMTGVEQLVAALSGGNQQKVVLAKWLATEPRVLILDEPTRGIDIGAKVEVHRIISDLAASGLAIILISSDLPEVLAMSDRILVLHEGRVTAEIRRAEATEERVMFAATGQDARSSAASPTPAGPPDG